MIVKEAWPLPARVVDLGRVDVDVWGDRLVHEGAEAQVQVRRVLPHPVRQGQAHCLQLERERGREGERGEQKGGREVN